MKTSDFNFDLPPRLIAQYPPEERGQSRLMILNRQTGKRARRMVAELPEIVSGPEFRGANGEPPLLVFNDSKVRKARLIGRSLQTGAQVEFLLLEDVGNGDIGSVDLGGTRKTNAITNHTPGLPDNTPHSPSTWKVLVQRAKRRKIGSRYAFFDTEGVEIATAEISGGDAPSLEGGEFRFLQFDRPIDDEWLDRYGHIPLPPYIKRQDAPLDADRYQTVYAAAAGSSAAPTAGLHFTHELLDRLGRVGIETVFITLHVGLGTFLPVRAEHIEDHVMHNESFYIDEPTASKIETAKAAGRKIIAVGTTSVRTLESAWGVGNKFSNYDPHSPLSTSHSLKGSTSIFIYPGYQFKVVDALFTNFHTPESTLLMLVSAFAGRELILESYAEAIREGYRFFSYGDAMLIM